MGQVISFNSPALGGASTSANTYAFHTSYAFAPSDGNAFGIEATITFAGITSLLVNQELLTDLDGL